MIISTDKYELALQKLKNTEMRSCCLKSGQITLTVKITPQWMIK